MGEVITERVEKYPEEKWRRTFVYEYNDGGWVIGEQVSDVFYYVVSLDGGGLVLCTPDELAY